jgi:hypothetical protein
MQETVIATIVENTPDRVVFKFGKWKYGIDKANARVLYYDLDSPDLFLMEVFTEHGGEEEVIYVFEDFDIVTCREYAGIR